MVTESSTAASFAIASGAPAKINAAPQPTHFNTALALFML
jgi:hypothetical protein